MDAGAPKRGQRARPADRPTMADVGRLAGVSATAVSFVINGRADGAISPETQQRVLDAVAKLGYRPNLAAQSLRTRRSRTIGFVTDEIAVKGPGGQSISAIHDVAQQSGSLVLIVNATREQKVLRRAVDDLLDRQVDAIVLAAIGTKRATVPDSLRHVPTVLVNCFSTGDPAPSIIPNEADGGRAAAELVIAAGHREIAFITGGARAWATQQRNKGYLAALRAAGIRDDSARLLEGNFRADSGHDLTRRLLARRRRPTAIVCGNDLMALGAYFAINEHGLRVPDDISVVGYDDLEDLASDIQPALSTIRIPYYEMGRMAAEHLLRGTVDALPRRTAVPCPVLARASVGPPPTRVDARRRRENREVQGVTQM
jgi:LacI family transcriptional regulator